MERLILIGAGGYAKSVIDSIDIYNYQLLGFIDEDVAKDNHLGYPVIAHSLDELIDANKYVFFVAIGNNALRKKWFDKLISFKLRVINVVDKTAVVSPTACIGTGCFIGKQAIVNSKAIVGNNCVINTRALVEHGCNVSDHANLSTNSVINGDVIVGEGTFVGSCSVTIGQLEIGSWSTIGAGAVVIKNVDNNVTVAGVPAKIIKKGAMLG